MSVIAQGGLLDAPASVAFGQTPRARNKLYITSFAIHRYLGAQPGEPHPALLSMWTLVPGLWLP